MAGYPPGLKWGRVYDDYDYPKRPPKRLDQHPIEDLSISQIKQVLKERLEGARRRQKSYDESAKQAAAEAAQIEKMLK